MDIVLLKKAENDLKISRLCQLMNVPIASYYYRSIVKPEAAQHLEALIIIHKENFQAYGRRRMKVALGDQGIQLGIFKIARLMKAGGTIAKVPKKPHYYASGKQRSNIHKQLNR
jgi:putative transposase